jgi:hypothetical protein
MLIMRTTHTRLPLRIHDPPPHMRQRPPGAHHLALHPVHPWRHGAQVGHSQRSRDMSGVQEPRPGDRQQRRARQIVQHGCGGPAVEVARFVAQGGDDSEGVDGGLRGGGGGEEDRVGKYQGVEAGVGGVGGEGRVHGEAAVEGGLGQVWVGEDAGEGGGVRFGRGHAGRVCWGG